MAPGDTWHGQMTALRDTSTCVAVRCFSTLSSGHVSDIIFKTSVSVGRQEQLAIPEMFAQVLNDETWLRFSG